MYALIKSRAYLREIATGATHKTIYMPALQDFHICHPTRDRQIKIVGELKAQLTEAEKAREAAQAQLRDTTNLADAIVFDSIKGSDSRPQTLGLVLEEVKKGIGKDWASYPVLGATRDGLAPAKEQPGKQAPKYKPAVPGTVFYNPMRILIGSIAFVDEDDAPGITSPDYVVIKGKDGVIDSRWFYYWLRSPFGERCILSLARGAVRERMLFNRLAEGIAELPSHANQEKASAALKELRPLRRALERELREIDLLPQKILAQAF
jgi:type I restriction enzyme S subunit